MGVKAGQKIPKGKLNRMLKSSDPVHYGYARHGWSGTFATFTRTDPAQVLAALQEFIPDAGPSQVTAWRDSIRLLHTVALALVRTVPLAAEWSLVLEYQMPMEAQRADEIILVGGAVILVEFKGTAARRILGY